MSFTSEKWTSSYKTSVRLASMSSKFYSRKSRDRFTQLEATFLRAGHWTSGGDVDDSGTCQKKSEPFFQRRQESAHLFPGRVDARYTRVMRVQRVHACVRACVRAWVRAYYAPLHACEPDLTKSGQMSILNVAQVGAVRRRRKPTRCICASPRKYVRVFTRGQIRFSSHCTCPSVLYRWHRNHFFPSFVVTRGVLDKSNVREKERKRVYRIIKKTYYLYYYHRYIVTLHLCVQS